MKWKSNRGPYVFRIQMNRTPNKETAQIQKAALYALLLNVALAIMKGALACYSQSLAVTASAIDSTTDAIASLVLMGGVKLSMRKFANFPLGLYKIENVISVVVAFFIFFAGYEIAHNVLSPSAVTPRISIAVVLFLIAGVAATLIFGQYALSVGEKTGSPTMVAEGRHRKVDVISNSLVLASVVLDYFGWKFNILGISVDRITAGVVLIFIGHAGWELLSGGMRVLLDASIDFQTLDRVRKIIEKHPMVIRMQSLVGRNAGRFRFLEARVALRTDDLHKAHRIGKSIEVEIREQVPHVENVTIYYEPTPRSHAKIAVPLTNPAGKISNHFGESPWFAVVTLRLSDNQVEKQEMVKNPYLYVKTAKGIRVAEWLVRQKVDQVVMKEDLSRKGPGYVLANAGVTVARISAKQLSEAIDGIQSQGE